MASKDRILAVLAGGRILGAADLCREADCHRSQILRQVDVTISAFGGGYCLPEVENRLLMRDQEVKIARRFPGAVLCLTAAARHWKLTTTTAESSGWTFLVRNSNPHTADGTTFIRTTRSRFLTVGVDDDEILPGLVLRMTNPARTVCDIFSSRSANINAVPDDEAFEILENYMREVGPVDAAARLTEISVQLGRKTTELSAAIEAMKRSPSHGTR
jgi:hypothetical protein